MITPARISPTCSNSGFSLIQLSLLLTAAGLIMVAMLPGVEVGSYLNRMQVSHQRMMRIEKATEGFMAANGRRPCPADATVDLKGATFGREAANAGSCAGGTPAANFDGTAANANAVAGGVPNVALGLPDEYAFDGFGNRFTYVVDRRATAKSTCLALQGGSKPKPGNTGDIEIRDAASSGKLISNTMWAIISHGQDAHGAFPMQGQGMAGGGSLANRLNTGNTDPETLKNASVNSSFATVFSKLFVKKERTYTSPGFDDLTWYADNTKNTCCVGSICKTQAVRFDGSMPSEHFAWDVASGDINGDGKDDVIMSSKWSTEGWAWYAGHIYVVYGHSFWGNSEYTLNSTEFNRLVDGTNGFVVTGDSSAVELGLNIAVGDVNGDGIDDIVSGTGWSHRPYYACVIFGKTGNRPAKITTADLDGSNGFCLLSPYPQYTQEWHGNTVGVGDINGDGFADIIVTPGYGNGNPPPDHAAYVVFGKSSGWTGTFALSALNGTNGFRLDDTSITKAARDRRVSAGDINHDGFDDIVLASLNHDNGALSNAGRVYVLFGKASGWTATADLPTLVTTGGFIIEGDESPMSLGGNLQVKDINNDDFDDIILGASTHFDWMWYPGSIHVVYGKSSAQPASSNISTFMNGTNGYRLNGNRGSGNSFGTLGISVSDINNDGVNDLLVGQAWTYPVQGKPVIIYGKTSPWAATTYIDTPYLTGPLGTGFTFLGVQNASDFLWSNNVAIGNFNGDAHKDFLFAVDYADPNGITDASSVHLIFGKPLGKWQLDNDLMKLYQ